MNRSEITVKRRKTLAIPANLELKSIIDIMAATAEANKCISKYGNKYRVR